MSESLPRFDPYDRSGFSLLTVNPKLKRAAADHPLGEQEMIHGSSASDHLGKGTSGHCNPRWVILGGHSVDGSFGFQSSIDVSGHCEPSSRDRW